jgi:hypothetical protein
MKTQMQSINSFSVKTIEGTKVPKFVEQSPKQQSTSLNTKNKGAAQEGMADVKKWKDKGTNNKKTKARNGQAKYRQGNPNERTKPFRGFNQRHRGACYR